jgi:hypothetical protein
MVWSGPSCGEPFYTLSILPRIAVLVCFRVIRIVCGMVAFN